MPIGKDASVYVIGTNPDAPVKIGISGNVKKRLAAIQNGYPVRLRVLRTVPGDHNTEKWFHETFKHLRLDGEWFTFDPEMLTIEPPPPAHIVKRRIEAEALEKSPYYILTIDFIKLHYGLIPNGAKVLSSHADCSVRTAEGWLQGRSPPDGDFILNIMASNDDFRCAFFELLRRRRIEKGLPAKPSVYGNDGDIPGYPRSPAAAALRELTNHNH